jgi:membrane associated rhomboid family serine protease
LIVSGWMERRFVPLVVSLVVTFVYGGILLSGVIPRIGGHISWDGHLSGAVAGGVIAYLMTKDPKSQEATVKDIR